MTELNSLFEQYQASAQSLRDDHKRALEHLKTAVELIDRITFETEFYQVQSMRSTIEQMRQYIKENTNNATR